MKVFKPPLYEKIINRALKYSDKVFGRIRRKRLSSSDFTIISNNCWGGAVYRYYNLPYNSPTVGLYFFAEEFIKLCKNLKFYMGQDLRFIPACESRYKNELEERGEYSCLIGVLGDVEMVFLHYKTKEEAVEKWERRTKRINWNNIILKFSTQNLCTDKHLQEFDNLNVSMNF